MRNTQPTSTKRATVRAGANALRLLGAACLIWQGSAARAGTVTYDFTTDPTQGANAIQIFQTGFADNAGNSVYWKADGGNPGGFLGITWPLGSSSTIAIFPDIDQGKIVTAFKFETDLRIGNPQQNERAADGFSINFARKTDPVFENHASSDFATSGAVETGTQTGLAISFDTWSGNSLPDGADIEGIIVRVDNVTILRQSMPTRNGACDDNTSLQTGPRDLPYWDAAKAADQMPDAAFLPASWAGLCWQHLSVELDDQSKLTVIYKGRAILDHFQTTFFPSAGGIVLAGRTGGADEHGHFDNLTLTTTTAAADTQAPTVPGNLQGVAVHARRVKLTWTASTDDSGKVGYEIERDGTALPGVVTSATFAESAAPNTSYSYKIRAVDPSGNKSAFTAAVTVKTPVETLTLTPGAVKWQAYRDIAGGTVDALTGDPKYPDSPDETRIVPAFESPVNTYEAFGGRLTGYFIPPSDGNYVFFMSSDDNGALYLSTDDKPANKKQIAAETVWSNNREWTISGGASDLDSKRSDTFPGSEWPTPNTITLKAGQRYYVELLYKEGGGGDNGGMTVIKAGEPDPASGSPAAGGSLVASDINLDAGPPSILQQPQSATVALGGSATFTAGAVGTKPLTYQWQRTGVNIPGATSASLTVNNAGASNFGLYTVVASNEEGSATSQSANLTVTGLPTVLFIHATAGPNDSDLAAMARIQSLGWQVTAIGAVPSQTSDADGKVLIAISSTVTSGEVLDKFRNVTVPTLNWEPALLDNFDETDRANDADTVTRGTAATQTQINIVKADHPLAAGLGAGLKTYLTANDASWGVVGTGATVVGTIADDPTHAVIYVYEKDATLFDGTKAPAKRVHFPGGDTSFLALNADGLKLFDAAVIYAAGGKPAPPAGTGNTIPNGLVAYWDFDGDLLDSIKDFDGTARGATPIAFVDGKAGFGKAIKLDGTGQFVEITGGNENELEFPGGSMSIAGWFKVDAFDTDWQALIAKGEGSNYRVARRAATGTIAYAGGVGEGADDVPAVNDGNWHHFVAISDATGAAFGTALYVDGVKHGVNATKPVLTANAAHLMIGENPEARSREWEGEIDDIAIWNRVLTESEISTLYNGGTGTPLSALTVPPSIREYSIGLNFGADEVNGTKTATLAATDVAGVPSVAQANWNNLSLLSGTNQTVVADVNGTAENTAVAVTWKSNNTWASTGSRGENNNKFTGNDLKLMTGYLDTGDATTTTVTVASIPAKLTDNGYDVYVYALGGVGGRGGGFRILDATTKQVLRDYVRAQSSTNPVDYVEVPQNLGAPDGSGNRTANQVFGVGNYIVFRGLKAPAFIVEARTAAVSTGLGFGAPPRAPINAIQLVAPTTGSDIQDVTQPGDTVVSSSTDPADSPAAEGVANVIDNSSGTKYLNFKKLNTGFTVTPSAGASIVTGLGLTSANDAPERDPASYKLEGSNDGTTFTTISEGAVPAFSGRFVRQEILFATPPSQFAVTLSGAAERPNPVNTTASGSGTLTVAGNQVTYSIDYSGLSAAATAGHIHGPATADQAANVMVPFPNVSGTAGTLTGTLTLDAAQLTAFQDGLTYANIHTANNPGGEIRGQILPASFKTYRLTFPTVANGTTANSMQIAEVELLGTVEGGPSAAEISISAANGKVTITFQGTLQSADLITGPFTAVAGATSPFTVTPDGTAKFYIAR